MLKRSSICNTKRLPTVIAVQLFVKIIQMRAWRDAVYKYASQIINVLKCLLTTTDS